MPKLSKLLAQMDPSWQTRLAPEFEKPYMQKLEQFLAEEGRAGRTVFPPPEFVFNAFAHTPFNDVSVVIIGQDPYHGAGQAHGLSFSVPPGIDLPPSLKNIFKELGQDLGVKMPTHGCLAKWAKQGVLLLNAGLTVRADEAGSHRGQGWEIFTDRVVQLLCEREEPVIFLLWGKSALGKFQHVKECAEGHHLALTAAHPSPLSAYAGFFGCGHFSKVNDFLKKHGKKPIDWSIE